MTYHRHTTDDISNLDDALDGKAPAENGFVDRADSTLSFVDGTRTFTITPVGDSFEYFQASRRYTKTAADSIVIPDSEGLHFIYYEGEDLVSTQSFMEDIITLYAFIVAIYWDATNNTAILFHEERHGNVMDSTTHSYNHNTLGARYGSGLGLGNMTVDGSGDVAASAQFSVGDGTIWDEDILHTIADGSPQELDAIAEIPLYYRSGANGDWRKVAATQYPVTTTGSGRAAWNELTGGSWQLTEVASNDYVLTHYFATGDLVNPIIALVGQEDYATITAAREGASVELAALQTGPLSGLTLEFVAIATVIWETSNSHTNAVKSRIRSTDEGDDYIDWRGGSTAGGGSGGGGVTDHQLLSNRSASGAHPQSSITDLVADQAAQDALIAGNTTNLTNHTTDTNNPHGTNWANLGGKPSTFPPESHTHLEVDITDLDKYTQAEVDAAVNAVVVALSNHTTDTNNPHSTAYGDLLGIPASFPPDAHQHSVSELVDYDWSTTLDDITNNNSGGVVLGTYEDAGKQKLLVVQSQEATDAGIRLKASDGTSMLELYGAQTFGAMTIESNIGLSLKYAAAIGFEIQAGATTVIDIDANRDVTLSDDLEVNGTITQGGTAVSLAGHTHLEADITDLDKYTQAEVDTITGAIITSLANHVAEVNPHGTTWDSLLLKPSTFPPEAHQHSTTELVDYDWEVQTNDITNTNSGGVVLGTYQAAGDRELFVIQDGVGASRGIGLRSSTSTIDLHWLTSTIPVLLSNENFRLQVALGREIELLDNSGNIVTMDRTVADFNGEIRAPDMVLGTYEAPGSALLYLNQATESADSGFILSGSNNEKLRLYGADTTFGVCTVASSTGLALSYTTGSGFEVQKDSAAILEIDTSDNLIFSGDEARLPQTIIGDYVAPGNARLYVHQDTEANDAGIVLEGLTAGKELQIYEAGSFDTFGINVDGRDLTLQVDSGYEVKIQISGGNKVTIGSDGSVTIDELAGVGTADVQVDANGKLIRV